MRYGVIDYFTGIVEPQHSCIRFVNEIIDNVTYYEYTRCRDKLLLVPGRRPNYYNKERFEDMMIFDRSNGTYRISAGLSDSDLTYAKWGSTVGYNYTFTKQYAANKHLELFDHRQKLINPEIDFKLSKFLKYSIGVEFETATGVLPEAICFRDGLIPLRDGSITGNEYSSIVLEGNYGLNLLKQQVETLKDYTYFDKNCSLHIHLGGFKLEPRIIFNIYKICVSLQNQLETILPPYTFHSGQYKSTGKDYCKKLPAGYGSFERLYSAMTGATYFGDLHQPHPADITRDHKWNINTRYFFVNFINAICYEGSKTIEFRFLRPTYNFNKIIFWLYIFNAIVIAAESDVIITRLEDLGYFAYPEDIAKELVRNILKVQICTYIQVNMNDNIGERIDVEDHIFSTSELI